MRGGSLQGGVRGVRGGGARRLADLDVGAVEGADEEAACGGGGYPGGGRRESFRRARERDARPALASPPAEAAVFDSRACSISNKRAPFMANFMFEVPEASVPAVEMCWESSDACRLCRKH